MNLAEVIQRGVAASRPGATTVPIGTIYFSSDTLVTERSNGTTWDSISDGGALADNAVTTAKIINDAVTYAKIQNVTDIRLLGRAAGSAGDVQEITVSGATLAAGVLTVGSGTGYWTGEVTQAIDQDVDGTTLTDSTNLQLAVTAGDVWHILLIIIYSAESATNDFLWDVAVSTGTMSGNGFHNGMSSTDAAVVGGITLTELTTSANITAGTAAAHGIRAFQAEFTIVFSATATFTFRFAESTSTTGVARLRAKSKLFSRKISP